MVKTERYVKGLSKRARPTRSGPSANKCNCTVLNIRHILEAYLLLFNKVLCTQDLRLPERSRAREFVRKFERRGLSAQPCTPYSIKNDSYVVDM